MPYVSPDLTLIGHASGVVLGSTKLSGIDPQGSDPQLTSDTEW
jgi:hypothetical protein